MTGADFVTHLQGILLGLTVFIFLVIAAWAYSPKTRKHMDDSAQIPLRDDR